MKFTATFGGRTIDAVEDRLPRLDLRLAKGFAVTPRVRAQANPNVYNVFNGSAISGILTSYGPVRTLPTLVRDGRRAQISGTVTFQRRLQACSSIGNPARSRRIEGATT